jgi:hypothetical protein
LNPEYQTEVFSETMMDERNVTLIKAGYLMQSASPAIHLTSRQSGASIGGR